jgi:hypothetical protein
MLRPIWVKAINKGRRAYCDSCGSPVAAGDKFWFNRIGIGYCSECHKKYPESKGHCLECKNFYWKYDECRYSHEPVRKKPTDWCRRFEAKDQ